MVWDFSGINLRSKKKGIFPSVCAIDLNFHTGGFQLEHVLYAIITYAVAYESSCVFVEDLDAIRPVKYYVRFVGSVEVGVAHKSNSILGQAIDRVGCCKKR